MAGLVHPSLRGEMMAALAGKAYSIVGAGDFWQFSLLMAGVELSGSGYSRATVNTGKPRAALWSRTGTTVTVTTTYAHNLTTGDVVDVSASSDNTAVPLGDETVTVTGATTFTFAVPGAGGTGGGGGDTLTFIPEGFWDVDSDTGVDELQSFFLVQMLAIAFPAASGAAWTFDEMRMHIAGATGAWAKKIPTVAQVTVADGDQLIIPAGTLTLTDRTLELSL